MSQPGPARYLAACMTYANHASYLQEWIEFHKLVGIERFYLYDNGSSDDHEEVLAPYVEEGTVVAHHWPGVGHERYAARDHCLATYGDEARWIAFFDDDEFLFSPSGKPVSAVLRDYEEWPAVGVNSAVFLLSGHKKRPPGTVIENYTMRRPLNHRAIKSIVDPKRTLQCESDHHFAYTSGHAVDLAKQPVEGPRTEKYTQECETVLRINHYHTKSEEELREKWSVPRPSTGQTRDPAEYERLVNLPHDDLDEKILIYLPALKEALRERAQENRKIPL
jgi:glycosyl transferase family 92